MVKKPIIIGVIHLPDRLESVITRLAPIISQEDKIGIEPSPEDLKLYDEVKEAEHPFEELYELVKKRDNLNDSSVSTEEFHEFYLGIHSWLLKHGAVPIGIGSRVRDTFSVEFVRKFFVNGEECTQEEFSIDSFMSRPHFDHYVARRIEEEKLRGVIIGCDHRPIARLARGRYIDFSGRAKGDELSSRWVNNILHREYPKYKEKLPIL